MPAAPPLVQATHKAAQSNPAVPPRPASSTPARASLNPRYPKPAATTTPSRRPGGRLWSSLAASRCWCWSLLVSYSTSAASARPTHNAAWHQSRRRHARARSSDRIHMSPVPSHLRAPIRHGDSPIRQATQAQASLRSSRSPPVRPTRFRKRADVQTPSRGGPRSYSPLLCPHRRQQQREQDS